MKAVLSKTRTDEGRAMRKAYDRHQVGFVPTFKTRTPRMDGVSNTLTSFTTDNLVLIIQKCKTNL